MSQVDDIYKEERWPKSHVSAAGAPSLYGEITRQGVENIISKFRERLNDPSGVFYDLGSGTGKMVTHIAVECRIGESIGIEYYKDRHDEAVSHSKQYIYKSKNPPQFINSDIFEVGCSDATVIYADLTHPSFHSMVQEKLRGKIPKDCLFIYKGMSLWSREVNCFRGHVETPTTYSANARSRWLIFK